MSAPIRAKFALLSEIYPPFDGFEFSNTPDKEYSRLDGLAGVEYSGISDATITLDIANRHYFDFDKRLKDSPDFQKEDLFEWALRITKPYLKDALKLTFLANTFGPTGDDGAVQRFSAEYDYTDAIQLSGGIVFYHSNCIGGCTNRHNKFELSRR